MKLIEPFAAYRPQAQYVNKVIAPPYDVINRQQAQRLAQDNPTRTAPVRLPS